MNNMNLSIMFWNCRSIKKKYLELYDILHEKSIDICILTETWLTNSDKIPQMGYSCIRRDRIDRCGGGIAILVNKNIKNYQTFSLKTSLIENIGLKIKTPDSEDIHIIGAYFPGGVTNATKKGLYRKDLRQLLKVNEKTIVCGDLNSRHKNWNCTRANGWGNILCDVVSILPYNIMYPDSPTYIPSSANINSSTIDIIISNISHYISQPIVTNSLSSDHLPVSYKLKFKPFRENRFQYNYKKCNWYIYKSLLDKYIAHLNTNVELVTDTNIIDTNIEFLTKSILDAIDIAVPKICIQQKQEIPDSIKLLIQIRNYYRREWIRYRYQQDNIIMKLYNKKIQQEMSAFRNQTWTSKIQNLGKASKPFWNISKCLRKNAYLYHPLTAVIKTFIAMMIKLINLLLTF